MNIQLFEPLSRGWDRMVMILFRPFDIGKWFTLGFTAFLAGLMNGMGKGGGGARGNHGPWKTDASDFFQFPEHAWEWLLDHPVWTSLIISGVAFLVVLVVLLTWLSSRGKFMFLDNVVNNRDEVVKPWKEYGREGDSLFTWRLVYGLVVLSVMTTFFILVFLSFRTSWNNHASAIVYITKAIVTGLLFLVLTMVVSYISLFLDSFVVPVMYKNRIGARRAWGIFLGLFTRHAGYFLIYGIVYLVLVVAAVITAVLLGIFTCCIGFVLLVIPYINAVVLLPVSVTLRAYSIEFLKQFGQDVDVFQPAGQD